jgi:hypothetical protein
MVRRSGGCVAINVIVASKAEFLGHTSTVNHALVHRKFIYTAGDDGTVREWKNLDLSEVTTKMSVRLALSDLIDMFALRCKRERDLAAAQIRSMPTLKSTRTAPEVAHRTIGFCDCA